MASVGRAAGTGAMDWLVLGTQACWSQSQRVSSYLPVPQSVQDEDQQTLLTKTRKISDSAGSGR